MVKTKVTATNFIANGHDCGVFVCQFALNLAAGKDINAVKQDDMLFYRKKMVLQLVQHGNKDDVDFNLLFGENDNDRFNVVVEKADESQKRKRTESDTTVNKKCKQS